MKTKTLVLALIVLIAATALSGCTEKPQQKSLMDETNVYPDIDSAFDSGKPVVVYFYDSFCSNCKDQQPIVELISTTVGDRGVVLFLDRNLNEAFASEYSITNSPNILVFDAAGEVVSTGYLNSDKLDALLDGL
ncbi:MAG TPA: hypothetical protein C5S51_04695 [Methanosarcinaceae archaeon]|nr:hypothetical protein [Methanosarcinaceae archaeon]